MHSHSIGTEGAARQSRKRANSCTNPLTAPAAHAGPCRPRTAPTPTVTRTGAVTGHTTALPAPARPLPAARDSHGPSGAIAPSDAHRGLPAGAGAGLVLNVGKVSTLPQPAPEPAPELAPELARKAGRDSRYTLRNGLRKFTGSKSVEKCGRCRIGSHVSGMIRPVAGGGRAHLNGLATCGLVWLCPVCSAKITARRATEVDTALRAHLAAGGGVEFLTATFPHDVGDALAPTRRLAADAWKRVQQGRAWLTVKRDAGIIGTIRALEVTHGANGWHPHVHTLMLTEKPLDERQRAGVLAHVFAAWSTTVQRAGHRAPLPCFTTLEPVRDAGAVAGYIAKVGALAATIELTHGAVKTGHRTGQRTAFTILADYIEHRRPRDLMLWREWEAGIAGARQLTWSRGLKAMFAVAEKSDEEIAGDDEPGSIVAGVLSADDWTLVLRHGVHAELHILHLTEQHWNNLPAGEIAVQQYLDTLRQRHILNTE